jgi:hypothetical protein
VLLPLGWSVVFLAVLRVVDAITGECSVCGSHEDWDTYPVFHFILVVLPLTAVMFVGVLLYRAYTRVRGPTNRRPSGRVHTARYERPER